MSIAPCQQCGRPLRPNAPHGLCSACLLEIGLAALPQPSEPVAPPAPEPAVLRVGDYELLEEIARGGMGVVYKARQLGLNRIVALKLILGGKWAGREQVQRFRAEAQAAANLHHPNLVAIHEVGEHEGQLYFSMDYLEGKNLAQVISQIGFRSTDFRRSARWMKTAAEAVHYAHQRGILHRDLKPANIIIDQDDQPHITDFGLAKRLYRHHGMAGSATGGEAAPAAPGPDDELTLTGQVLGSPSFLSPEQAEGKRGAVSVASDVYSLGAVVYHLLTGRPPFQGETLTALLRQVIDTEPVAPRRLNPSIPHDLETICLKCLEKEPRRRYASAQELADELGRFLADEPIRARPANRAERVWRWCRRNPKLAGALGAVVLSLALGLVTTTWQMRRAQAGELLALQRAYVSDMDLAARALADDDIGRVRDLLDRYAPQRGSPAGAGRRPSAIDPPPSTDLRGWEWQYFWEKSRSQAAFRLCTRSKQVSGLAFTADGRRLVVHEQQGVTLVYDLATRQPVPGLVQTNLSWRMGFCPATDRVAYQLAPEMFANGEIRIWDTRSNVLASQLPFTNDCFCSFVFSPGGHCLAAFASNSGVQVWDLATARTIMRVRAEARYPQAQVWTGAVAFDPTGEVLAVGDRTNGLVRLFGVPDGRVKAQYNLPAGEVLTLAFSPDGRWLAASAAETNNVSRVWPLPSGEPIELTVQRQTPWALAFDPRSEILATGDGQIIRLWDLAGRHCLTKLVGHRLGIGSLAFSPDGEWLASGSNASGTQQAEVLLWEVAKLRRPEQPDYQVLTNSGLVTFESDGRSFLALADGTVTRFNVDTLRPIEPLLQYGTNNVNFAVSSDGRWLAYAGTNGVFHFWERNAPREQPPFCPYPGTVLGRTQVRVLARGRLLAILNDDRVTAMRLWDTSDWQEPEPWRSLNAEARGACICADASNDGRFLATGHNDGRVFLWEVKTGRELKLFDGHRAIVFEVAFSPDGRWLASAAWDGSLKLWDVRRLRKAGSFGRLESPCYGITFSPDSRRVANGGLVGSRSVGIWDVRTREHLADLVGPGRFFFFPRFSPDERTLAVLKNVENDTYFWRVPSLADIDAAEKGSQP